MRQPWLSIVAALAIFAHEEPAVADFLGDVAKVVTAPVTVPAQTTINVIRGDDPAAPVRGAMQSAGATVSAASSQFQQAQDVFVRAQRNTIDQYFGPDWVRGFDTLTASQRVQFELATTSGRFLGGCMQGRPCTINQVVAGPLAAAMRDAYKAYNAYGTPLDPNLAQFLSDAVPWRVLNNAKWAVGATPDFTVPGFLNAGYEVAGQGHAVTIADLMIFSRPLDFNNWSDINWLLHEMRHIEQYMSYSSNRLESIDGFAVDYVTSWQGMENDAQNTADNREAVLHRRCGC